MDSLFIKSLKIYSILKTDSIFVDKEIIFVSIKTFSADSSKFFNNKVNYLIV